MKASDKTVETSGKVGADQTRRAFVKTVTYVAPAILTLAATPALATPGSGSARYKAWAWQDGQGNWQGGGQ